MRQKRYPAWNVNSLTGLFAVVLGAFSLLGTISLRYPEIFATPELRALVPLYWVRFLLQSAAVTAIAFGWLNVARHSKKTPGLAGFAFALMTLSLGEPSPSTQQGGIFLGLDWFVLDLFFTALIFIPLERAFALYPAQPVIRRGARTDLAHFFVSHVSVQAVTFLAVLPAAFAFRATGGLGLRQWVASLPGVFQFFAIMLVADLVEYAVHRTYHRIPALWRFHSVHHSSRRLDWLAASRIHIVEALSMRALTYLPIYVLGFSSPAIFAYLAFVSFHAIFIHANVHWRFLWLDGWFVTPRYHHWHHADEKEAYDTNFALHFPLWDRLFGTYYLPAERWPAQYGVREFPELSNYFAHLAYPFRQPKAPDADTGTPAEN